MTHADVKTLKIQLLGDLIQLQWKFCKYILIVCCDRGFSGKLVQNIINQHKQSILKFSF